MIIKYLIIGQCNSRVFIGLVIIVYVLIVTGLPDVQFQPKHYMELLQTMWTSYSFIHDVKSHLTFFWMLKKVGRKKI